MGGLSTKDEKNEEKQEEIQTAKNKQQFSAGGNFKRFQKQVLWKHWVNNKIRSGSLAIQLSSSVVAGF